MSGLRAVLARLAALFVVAMAMLPGSAQALNVPGSAAGGFIVDTVFYVVDDATALAQGGGGVSVAGQGFELASIDPVAGSQFDGFIAGGGSTRWGISATFDYRLLDLDSGALDLDYNLFAGSVALGYAVDPQLTLVGGALIEYGFGSSEFNAGTIDGIGFGTFGGAVYQFDPRWTLSGFAGIEAINFDVTRAGGAITGDYDATRVFVLGELDYRDNSGALSWRLGTGMRYIYQDSEGYQETGGVFVPSVEEDVFSVTARARLGYTVSPGFTPFGQIDVQYDIVDDTSTAAGIVTLSESLSDWSVRGSIGAELIRSENARLLAQWGSTFSGDGFDGMDIRLNAQLRF